MRPNESSLYNQKEDQKGVGKARERGDIPRNVTKPKTVGCVNFLRALRAPRFEEETENRRGGIERERLGGLRFSERRKSL